MVTRQKQLHKKVFDAAPAKLIDRPPSSGKATVPFGTMVSTKWREENPDAKLLDGAPWLKGFYERYKDSDDLFEEDHTYLKELNEWHLSQCDYPAGEENGPL